ncbi:TAXI family TRAP transporter solute-binding subunit [Sulfurisoma sediminicola]|uniref:TRAP transporter TAXI family solute receptor n=1 Tax=Sulfurisoma sediminicola TaxID=1381557 RepID=A0A497X992_9PROT|nr:TAXI family TRAP transporter solute-binding subunit [Sulfurisoma sediminicola]RLJ62153.1 TRAP transporter TAXI family solute receptor [Sulfurisoma sediminicola]
MLNPIKLRHIRDYSLRDLLLVGLPLLVLIIAGFWGASRFIKPAPPDTLVLSSGGEGGAYQRFAVAYKDALARYGVRLIEKPSAGSTENLQRLRDPDFAVDAAFLQGGTARLQEGDALYSLGSLYYEPLWIFHRGDLPRGKGGAPAGVAWLKGKRVAIGAPGSGANYLAREILQAHQMDEKNVTLVEQGGLGLGQALAAKKIDAAFIVGPAKSAAIWTLLNTPGVRLMNLAHADAYTRRFPYLSKVVLPRGTIDLDADVPAEDITLVAPTATLVVREDTHPVLVGLLMQVLAEVHSEPGAFQRPGEFPRPAGTDFPLAPEAERYYKSGKPFLQRYLPFWVAVQLDRLVVMLIPLLALLVPLVKIAPTLYGWRVRSRIFRRYGELKLLEAEVEDQPGKHSREEWLARLDALEAAINRIQTPLAFSDVLYTLRSHVLIARQNILKRLEPLPPNAAS